MTTTTKCANCEELLNLILSACPLAWSTGNYWEDAAEWEKRAIAVVRKVKETSKND